MVNLKAIQSRLKAVTNTSKITKAMKMVAASKLRRAQTALEEAGQFSTATQGLMEPYLLPKEEDEKAKSNVLLAISSDKGLCGGINSKVVKEVKTTLDNPEQPETTVRLPAPPRPTAACRGSTARPPLSLTLHPYPPPAPAPRGTPQTPRVRPQLMLVGSKARDGLTRTHGKHINVSFDETYAGPVTFSLASFLAEQMLAQPADTYTILYNKFKSVIAQEVTPVTIKGPEALGGSGVMDEYEFEGDKESVVANLYQYNLACLLYGALLENVTSEQASRMSAMDSASNNASEMIGKLTIIYNRGRQAKITTELTEIVAGAESV